MSAKLGVDYCNSSVCTPRTTDCGTTGSYTLICGKLTVIEDSTVYDSIACALVRALEGGDITCSTLIVLLGIDNVDRTVLKVRGIVSTEYKVGVTRDEYVLEVLTACEELKSILNTKKLGVLHNESVSLNEECKSSFNSKTCLGHSLLAVPVVRNGNVFNSYVGCRISDSNGSGGVGSMNEAAGIGQAVKRIPLDNYVIGIITTTDKLKVRDSDLDLFVIMTGSEVNFLNCCGVDLSEEIKRLLNRTEYVIGSAKITGDRKIVRIYKTPVRTVLVRSRSSLGNTKLNSGIKTCVTNLNDDQVFAA